MAGESLSKLKLSVWRDFIPNRTLIFREDVGDAQSVLCTDTNLQQEVYSWQIKEDPFSGIIDNDLREKLSQLLFTEFEPSKPPSERSFTKLEAFFAEAKNAIATQNSEWTGSQDSPDDEDAPYRLNPLLALSLHLEWLSASFADQPGISVSIR